MAYNPFVSLEDWMDEVTPEQEDWMKELRHAQHAYTAGDGLHVWYDGKPGDQVLCIGYERRGKLPAEAIVIRNTGYEFSCTPVLYADSGARPTVNRLLHLTRETRDLIDRLADSGVSPSTIEEFKERYAQYVLSSLRPC